VQEATDPRLTVLKSAVVEVPRCGYCDEAVDPTLYLPCPTCGAHAHDHCLVQHGGCPTPGCEVTGPIARATVAARTLPPVERVSAMADALRGSGVRRGVSLVGGFAFTLGAGGVLVSLVAVGSPGGLLGVAGLVGGTMLVALGSWMHALVTLFAGPEAPSSQRTISAVLAGLGLGSGIVGMVGSTIALGLMDTAATSTLASLLAGGSGLLLGAGLVLSGGLGLAVLALDAVRRQT